VDSALATFHYDKQPENLCIEENQCGLHDTDSCKPNL